MDLSIDKKSVLKPSRKPTKERPEPTVAVTLRMPASYKKRMKIALLDDDFTLENEVKTQQDIMVSAIGAWLDAKGV